MIKGLDNLPLSKIEQIGEVGSPSKINVKITNNKLPPDFFNLKLRSKLTFSTPISRMEPQTQREPRIVNKNNPEVRRENVTARDKREKEEDLIMGVISTTR